MDPLTRGSLSPAFFYSNYFKKHNVLTIFIKNTKLHISIISTSTMLWGGEVVYIVFVLAPFIITFLCAVLNKMHSRFLLNWSFCWLCKMHMKINIIYVSMYLLHVYIIFYVVCMFFFLSSLLSSRFQYFCVFNYCPGLYVFIWILLIVHYFFKTWYHK